MRKILLALGLVAGLHAFPASAGEVLVNVTATRVDTPTRSGRMSVRVENHGATPIYCQSQTSTGLSFGTGIEIGPRASVAFPATSSEAIYCIAQALQSAGSGTVVYQSTSQVPWASGALVSTVEVSGGVSPEARVMPDATALTTIASGSDAQVRADSQGRLLVRTSMIEAGYVTTLSTATTLAQVIAAPTEGQSVYITDIAYSASGATTATADQQNLLKYGTGTNCDTGTTLLWGAQGAALATTVANFTSPLKVPAEKAVCYINAAAGTKILSLGFYVAP